MNTVYICYMISVTKQILCYRRWGPPTVRKVIINHHIHMDRITYAQRVLFVQTSKGSYFEGKRFYTFACNAASLYAIKASCYSLNSWGRNVWAWCVAVAENKARNGNNPWIWSEKQRGALLGFSYSEIRFLNKNIVKCLSFFLFCSITDNAKLHFCWLSMLSSIKCTSKNTKYKQIFRAVCKAGERGGRGGGKIPRTGLGARNLDKTSGHCATVKRVGGP